MCDNESNAARLWGLENRSPYPKDAINDYVVNGADDVNPDRVGTKAALHYIVEVEPGATNEIRLRLAHVAGPADEWSPEAANRSHAKLDLAGGYDQVMPDRADRGRRVLPGRHSRQRQRGRGDGATAGRGGPDVGQTVLPLRRGAMA